jgi:hypothetical protein
MAEKVKYSFFKIGEEDLPTASDDHRGQVRVKPHTIAEQGDRLMFCRMQDDGVTIAWANLTGVTVQDSDTTVGFGIGVLDFGAGLTVSESPADEANIAVDLAGVRQSTMIMDTRAQSSSDTLSTTSTTVWSHALDSMSIFLPNEGTWQVHARASCLMQHSAADRSQLRVMVQGDASAAMTVNLNIESRIVAEHVRSGLTFATVDPGGEVVCHLQFKSIDPGTTTTRNPEMQIIAIRTA